MKTIKIISRIGILALVLGMFSSTLVYADCPTGGCLDDVKSKDEILAEKLESAVFVDQDLRTLEEDFNIEGLHISNNDFFVKILNIADEVVYEGSFDGINTVDKTLKRYLAKADLLVNVGNTAYYMVF